MFSNKVGSLFKCREKIILQFNVVSIHYYFTINCETRRTFTKCSSFWTRISKNVSTMCFGSMDEVHLKIMIGEKAFKDERWYRPIMQFSSPMEGHQYSSDCAGFHSPVVLKDTMRNPSSKAKINVCVEGNIGSGKTTLLNYFGSHHDVQAVFEPVHKWRNLNGCNLLDLMYKDPTRWSHVFQTYVQLTMLENHMTACAKPAKLMERSIFSARHCFVENLYQSGKMTGAEYNVYCEWYNMMISSMDVGVDLIVYLRTDPHVLHKRISERNRSEESNIPLDYLISLHELHEKWLIEDSDKLSAPVLVINGNGDLDEMYSLYEKHSSRIVYNQPSVPTEPPSPVRLKSAAN